jgi:D-glycero-D-manno-heptose 1,7-bisphosphate phosphatase
MSLYMMDMDDTLITSGFVKGKWIKGHDYMDFELLPNVYDRLRAITQIDASARFAICTNQGGVAYGYQTEEDARTKVARVLAMLEFFWSRPFSVHICFNHPAATVDLYKYDDPRRKPNPGMLEEAIKWHHHGHTGKDQLHDARPLCVYVGDLETDRQAATAAGVRYKDHEHFFCISCDQCGGHMERAGPTYVCQKCGHNLGLLVPAS